MPLKFNPQLAERQMQEIKDNPEITKIEPPPKKKPLDTKRPQKKEINQQNPQSKDIIEDVPAMTNIKEDVPTDLSEINKVIVNGQKVQIKPTKFKYFRNRTTSIYRILKAVPLNEFLAYEKGTFDKERDSDQILYDFLIAVFDDAKFVSKNYNNMDADCLQKILEIFGRINHIDQKEEAARKNKQAQASSH